MATLAEQKTALEAALRSGAREVEFPDRSRVVYRDVSEIERALANVNEAIAAAAGESPAPRVLRFATSRGFGLGGS